MSSQPEEAETRCKIYSKWISYIEKRDSTDDNGNIYKVDGKLQPNNTYELNGNGYTTDDLGRIIRCDAKPQLTSEQDELLATTPTKKLLDLKMLQPKNIRYTLHDYQMVNTFKTQR